MQSFHCFLDLLNGLAWIVDCSFANHLIELTDSELTVLIAIHMHISSTVTSKRSPEDESINVK